MRFVARHVDLFSPAAGLGEVVGGVHSHEGLPVNAEGFFEADGDFSGEAGLGACLAQRYLHPGPRGGAGGRTTR